MRIILGGLKGALFVVGALIVAGVVTKLVTKLFMIGWNIL
jgi:hypothetical protein